MRVIPDTDSQERKSESNPWRSILFGSKHCQDPGDIADHTLESMHAWLWDELSFMEGMSMKEVERILEIEEVRKLRDLREERKKREVTPSQWYHAYADAIENVSAMNGNRVLVPNSIPRERLLPVEGFQESCVSSGRSTSGLMFMLMCISVLLLPFVLRVFWPQSILIQFMVWLWAGGIALGVLQGVGYGYLGLLGLRFHAHWAAVVASILNLLAYSVFAYVFYKVVSAGLDDVSFSYAEIGFVSASVAHVCAHAISKKNRWRRRFRPAM